MQYKLIAFDLDGTLLDNDKNIPERNMKALCAAAGRGVYVVPATGRIFGGLPQPIRDLPFIRYCITINGAYVYDAVKDTALYSANIPLETALEVYDYFRGLPVMIDCYQNNWGWMTRTLYEQAGEFCNTPGVAALIRNLRTPVDDLEVTLKERGQPVQKMQVYFHRQDMDMRAEMLKEMPERFPTLKITTSIENNIEINSMEADKGRALRELCSCLGIRPEEAVAFGDGLNDATMIEAAGVGVVMENAFPGLKQIADMVTLSNNESGVAEAMIKLGIIDNF